jgi:hypothetical protein
LSARSVVTPSVSQLRDHAGDALIPVRPFPGGVPDGLDRDRAAGQVLDAAGELLDLIGGRLARLVVGADAQRDRLDLGRARLGGLAAVVAAAGRQRGGGQEDDDDDALHGSHSFGR